MKIKAALSGILFSGLIMSGVAQASLVSVSLSIEGTNSNGSSFVGLGSFSFYDDTEILTRNFSYGTDSSSSFAVTDTWLTTPIFPNVPHTSSYPSGRTSSALWAANVNYSIFSMSYFRLDTTIYGYPYPDRISEISGLISSDPQSDNSTVTPINIGDLFYSLFDNHIPLTVSDRHAGYFSSPAASWTGQAYITSIDGLERSVAEPASLALLGIALSGLAITRRLRVKPLPQIQHSH